ncbi:hypothetical protein ACFL47_10260 [Candidatus Latescibacterota bacterium]
MPDNLSTSSSKPAFLRKSLVFIAIIVVLDFATGFGLRSLYFSQISGPNHRITYALDHADEDILIFGSSLANHTYIPRIFSDRLGHTCYNTGRDGADIYYYRALQLGIIKRYTPRLIILTVNINELIQNDSSLHRLSCLLPYYKTHPEIRQVLNLRSKFERIKLLSAIYPFNSMIMTIIRYNFTEDNVVNGYIPLDRSLTLTEVDSFNLDAEGQNVTRGIDRTKELIFDQFIEDCVRKNIRVVIIRPPVVTLFDSERESFDSIRDLANRHHVPVWDYTDDAAFYGKHHLFADRIHLNHTGAKIFSDMIAKRLKPALQTTSHKDR